MDRLYSVLILVIFPNLIWAGVTATTDKWFEGQRLKWPKEILWVIDPNLKEPPKWNPERDYFTETFQNKCEQVRSELQRNRGTSGSWSLIISDPAIFVSPINGNCPVLSCVIELPCLNVEGQDQPNCSEVVHRQELHYTTVAYTFDDQNRARPRVCGLQNVNEYKKLRELDAASFWSQFRGSLLTEDIPDPGIEDVMNNIWITNASRSSYVLQEDRMIIWGWRVGEYWIGQTDLMIPIMQETMEQSHKLNDSVRTCATSREPIYRWSATSSSSFQEDFRRVFICIGNQGAQKLLLDNKKTKYRESQTQICPDKAGRPRSVPTPETLSARRLPANQALYGSLQRRLHIPCYTLQPPNSPPEFGFIEAPGAHIHRDAPPDFEVWQSMSPFGM